MKKGMIIIFTLFAAIMIAAMAPMQASANAPSSVTLSYDGATQTLKVTIVHAVSSPDSHYIKTVEIKKNDNSVETAKYQSQPSPDEFSYTFKVPAKAGDTLEVKAKCNYFGSKSAKLIVP